MIEPIYENEWVKLYHGDCLEVMPELDITFDTCITDPPYGTTACKWDSVIPFEPMWKQLKRLVKSNGAICLFGSEPFSSALRMSNLTMFKYDWIYKKQQGTGFLNAKKQPLRIYEIVSIFYKQQPQYNPQKSCNTSQKGFVYKKKRSSLLDNCFREMEYLPYWKDDGSRYPVNILENMYEPGRFDSSKTVKQWRLHPTQKPIPLIEYLIKTYTNENECVLDFTAGSGTTGVACMETNRKCVLIEKEEKYCEITIKRLQEKEKEIAERLF